MTEKIARLMALLLLLLPVSACATAGIDESDFAWGPDPTEGAACAKRVMPELGGPETLVGLGCATEQNLRDMLVDQGDLMTPDVPTPARGDAAIDGARRHRSGQVRPLPSSGADRTPSIILRDQSGGQ